MTGPAHTYTARFDADQFSLGRAACRGQAGPLDTQGQRWPQSREVHVLDDRVGGEIEPSSAAAQRVEQRTAAAHEFGNVRKAH